MDIIMMVIGLTSMVATVISCIIAVKAKNESVKILNQIQTITLNTGEQKVENEGDFELENSGENSGVIAGIVTGGINNNAKEN